MVDSEPTQEVQVRQSGGQTTVQEQVVAKIAAISIRDIPGVHSLGTTSTRPFDAVRSAVVGDSPNMGVHVEVGREQAALDIQLVVEYPHPVREVADRVRAAIYQAVEEVTGLEVVEVNVDVVDVYLPDIEAPPIVKAEPRTLARTETKNEEARK